MSNYQNEYEQQQARRLQAHLDRTTARCELLHGRYQSALNQTTNGTTTEGRGRDEAVRRTEGHGRSPVNLSALDLAADIERVVARLYPLALGALRLGMSKGREGSRESWTAGRLLWFGKVLGKVWAEDPELGTEISDEVWKLDRKAARVLGEVVRAFPLVEPCGSCGLPALWASPELLEVRCGNPECGTRWRVSAPVSVAAV